MEKRTPHCSLAAVKALVAAGKVRTRHSGAAALGFDFSGMIAAVMNLTIADFYWPDTPAGRVYLKLTVLDDVLIVSFKEP